MRLIDLTDPAAPVEIAHYDTAGSAEVVTTSGDLVFVGLPEGKIIVLRVETHALPTATPRPSETPTPTAVPTETATATQTAEDRGNRIFLPLVERVGGASSGQRPTPVRTPAYNRPRIAVEGALR